MEGSRKLPGGVNRKACTFCAEHVTNFLFFHSDRQHTPPPEHFFDCTRQAPETCLRGYPPPARKVPDSHPKDCNLVPDGTQDHLEKACSSFTKHVSEFLHFPLFSTILPPSNPPSPEAIPLPPENHRRVYFGTRNICVAARQRPESSTPCARRYSTAPRIPAEWYPWSTENGAGSFRQSTRNTEGYHQHQLELSRTLTGRAAVASPELAGRRGGVMSRFQAGSRLGRRRLVRFSSLVSNIVRVVASVFALIIFIFTSYT